LLTIYHGSSLMGVIHLDRVGCISARMIGAGLGAVILKVSCILDCKVERSCHVGTGTYVR